MYVDFCDTRLCAPLACGVRYVNISQHVKLYQKQEYNLINPIN
jgi:hypothetical protein